MKRIIYFLLIMILSLGSATSCGRSRTFSQEENVLNFGCTMHSNSFDPAIDINAAWNAMKLGMTEGLFKFDDNIVPQYQLCDEVLYESADGKIYILHIKEGVRFSNGKICDAKAVADSLNRLYCVTKSDNIYYGSTATQYLDIKSCTADIEKNTVTIQLNTATTNLKGSLCFPFYEIIDVNGNVTDENRQGDVVYNQAAGYAPTEVIGTGPYVLTEFDEISSNGILQANPYYWQGEVPYKKINVIHIEQSSMKAMALESGAVDLTENITTSQDLAELKSDKTYKVSEKPGVRTGFAYVNFEGILKEDVIRQAVFMAIDRQLLCESVSGGIYTYGTSVLPTSLSYNANELRNPFPYNIAKANRLLDEADIVDRDGDGVREYKGENMNLSLITYVGRGLDLFANAVEISLKDIGIACSIRVIDDQSLWRELEAGEYDLLNCNWMTVGTGDPTDYLRNWYGGKHGDNLFSKNSKGMNYCNYDSDRYDTIFEKYLAEKDEEKRAEYILSLEQTLLDDAAVFVYGYYNSTMVSNRNKVSNAEISTIDYYWLSSKITPQKN